MNENTDRNGTNEKDEKEPAASPIGSRLEEIAKSGGVTARNSKESIHCLSIIGQIEGHFILDQNQKTTKYEHLIPLLCAVEESEEIDGLLQCVRSDEPVWIEDATVRKEAFRRILTAGDRKELLGMIRMLYLHREALNGKGKRLRTNDEQMLRDAEKLLNDEFALVLNIKPREVPEYIRSRLEEAS